MATPAGTALLQLQVVHSPKGASYPIIMAGGRPRRAWLWFLSPEGRRLAPLGEKLAKQLASLFREHPSKHLWAMVQGLMAK